MKYCLALLFAVTALASAVAQDLKCEIVIATTITQSHVVTSVELLDDGGTPVSSATSKGKETDPVFSKRSLLVVDTEAANITVYADDQLRDQVTLERIGESRWLIPPGKTWIEVRVVDFDKNIYDATRLFVDAVGDDLPPPPDIDADIEDEYGLGRVSAKFAPRHPGTRKIIADHHKAAADFLYGIPSLKAVSNEKGDDAQNNVFAWLKQEAAAMQCPDPETCQQWAEWRVEMGKAFASSQEKRQYTREDWYKSFIEISESLR